MSTVGGAPHVIVVGGGFAGLGCAKKLAKHGDVRITLLDCNNHHQFQPLLYQVATSQLGSSSVAMSLRKIFRKYPNVHVKLAEVASIDPVAGAVTATDGETWAGDAIVLAAGSRPNFFGTAGSGPSTPFPLLLPRTTPSGCGRASSGCSRMPIATPRCSIGARSTSSWSAAGPPASRRPGRSPT